MDLHLGPSKETYVQGKQSQRAVFRTWMRASHGVEPLGTEWVSSPWFHCRPCMAIVVDSTVLPGVTFLVLILRSTNLDAHSSVSTI